MPRPWPQQCRQNSLHSGPFSRSGLCALCRQEFLRAAGSKGARMGGGRPRPTAYKVKPSRWPSARRANQRSLACREGSRKCPTAGKNSRTSSEQMTPSELPSAARVKRKFTAHQEGGRKSETAARRGIGAGASLLFPMPQTAIPLPLLRLHPVHVSSPALQRSPLSQGLRRTRFPHAP